MRRLTAFFVVLAILAAALPSFAAGAYPVLETPPPARIHISPAASPSPPAVLNTVQDASAADGLRFKLDAEILHVWFPIIANADEAVLIYGDEVCLIDCGDKGMGLRGVRMLEELGVRKIDKLFNSHPHHDHIDGLQVTNEAVPVGGLFVCFPDDSTESMVSAMEYAKEARIPVSHYKSGDVFTLGDGGVSLNFFSPEDESLDMNNNSMQTLVQYGSRRILFTADMERPGQEVLLSRMRPAELRADIIKYPHHGKTGLVDEFYEAVSPSLAIITNVYVQWGGVDFLTWKRVPILFTCTHDAYLHLYTDGNTWVVERVPMGQVVPLFPKKPG